MNAGTAAIARKLSLPEVALALPRAAYIQPVVEHLTFPAENLRTLGFWNPVPLPSLGHIGMHLLNAHGEPVIELHGLSCDRSGHTAPAHTGFKGDYLFCKAEDGREAAALRPYATTPGRLQPIGSRAQKRAAFEAALAYMGVAERQPVLYTTPLSTTRHILTRHLRNYQPQSAEELAAEPQMAWRRRLLCPALLALPDTVLSHALSLRTGRRIRARGYNSNSVARGIADIFGVDMSAYSDDYTPWVSQSVKRYMRAVPKPHKPVARRAPAPALIPATA